MTLHAPTYGEAIGTQNARPTADAYRLGPLPLFLLCGLFAAFAYEIPLAYITSRYRLNPRAFDVAAFLLISYWLLAGNPRGWRIRLDHPLLKPWLTLVSVFAVMCATSVLFVPLQMFGYSVWYLLRYLLISVVLLIILNAPLYETQKRRLLWMLLFGGTWVSFYGILQAVGIVSNVRILPIGIPIADTHIRAMTSTLGTSYFHAGQFGIITGILGLTLFRCSKGFPRVVAGILGPFSMVPAVASGSRAGFIGLLVALAALGLQRENRKYVTSFLMAGFVAAIVGFAYSGSFTQERIERSEKRRDLTETGLFRGAQFLVTLSKVEQSVGPRVWLIGGGFYVVPIDGRNRVGYGVHNIFAFPLEQAGIFGFAASIWIWITLWNGLRPRRNPRERNPTDLYLRVGMFSYLAALLVVGWGGQIFWLGFGNENLCALQFLLFGLAMKPSLPDEGDERPDPAPTARELTSPYLLADDRLAPEPHP